jgi:hypothetical protein
MHPRSLRCSSIKYCSIFSVVAPCDRGASPVSVLRRDFHHGLLAMACNPLIQDPFEFPRRVANRPGLSRIDYRIGRYPEFVEAMTRGIDAALPLASWTHRTADDPGIALLEGAAILGDILTFYQQHYANEAYLRTAAWRESVSELVRLTGYRLAPGIGGRATLAFEARGTASITLRQGFPVKAELATGTPPAEFQTEAELVVWPHLGRFNLFRPRHYAVFMAGGQKQFEIASVGGATDSIALDALELKKGDRLLLVPEENLGRVDHSVLPRLDVRTAARGDRRRRQDRARAWPRDRDRGRQADARMACELPCLPARSQLPSLRRERPSAVRTDEHVHEPADHDGGRHRVRA